MAWRNKMFFWFCLDMVIILCVILTCFADRRQQRMLSYIVATVLVFVSGVRFMVGGDYASFAAVFCDSGENIAEILKIEPSFYFLAKVLKHIEISYQGMFLFYSFIQILFLYKGCQYWLNNDYKKITVALCCFCFLPFNAYWESMNTVREMTSVIIFLYSAKFLFERKYLKYILWTFVAACFHYSALLTLLYIPVANISWKKCYSILCIMIGC